MNTVIVPVDFSDISYNAGRYAAKLLQGYEGMEIILYNMYEADAEHEMIMEHLENFKNELLATATSNITVYAERGDEFVAELEKFARHRGADLVVMGIRQIFYRTKIYWKQRFKNGRKQVLSRTDRSGRL